MLGQRIKAYLIEKGIKQSFLSDKTNIPMSALNLMLNGNRKIMAEEYFLVCQALDVDFDYFIRNDIA